MALDAQSNWNVEMAQPLTRAQEFQPDSSDVSSPPLLIETKAYNVSQTILPLEIILQIVSYVSRFDLGQKTLWACCLVSRPWYAAAVPLLYRRPYLSGRNFQNFVVTVCPSKNAHIRQSQLAGFVRTLDMGELVHDGSKSLTARLLGRLKGNLVEFVAPQASFSINSFAALSKCKHLALLNLSLMSASVSTQQLFQTLQSLTELETLFFPRTSVQNSPLHTNGYTWPPRLKALHFGGGIDDFFICTNADNLPESLERLSMQLCPRVHSSSLQRLLKSVGSHLRHLTIRHPMTELWWPALDRTLTWCPNLEAVRISADYISDVFFDAENVPKGHPLQVLDIECSENPESGVEINPDSIWIAIDDGRLPHLRCIRVSARLAWTATHSLRTAVSDLLDLLEEQERKEPLGIEPGVWSIV